MSNHGHNEDRTEQVVSTLLSAAGKDPVPPDEAFLERLSGETVRAFIAASARRPKRFRGYRIMHSRTVKWLIPVAAAAAVVIVVGLWPGGNGKGVVLADVIQRLRSAHTVTCRSTFSVTGSVVGTANYMFWGDHLMRTETSDGLIYISDGAAGRGLLLDSRKKTAAPFEQIPSRFDFYKTLMEFRDGTETPLGTKRIQGRDAVGFLLPGTGGNASVWIDTRTRLPIRLEAKATGTDGQEQTITVEHFVLDAPLDESLFSLSIPEGYTEHPVRVSEIDQKLSGNRSTGKVDEAGQRVYVSAAERAREMTLRTRSLTALRNILTACIRYSGDHDGQWPEDLNSLEAYGIKAESLANPRLPDAAVGWVYRRPVVPAGRLRNAPKTVLIHEPLDPWDDGVHVGFADGHVEFVNNRDRIEKLLAE